MLKNLRANRRHARLMRAADFLILGQDTEALVASDLVALAFGRYQLRIDEAEAVDYLNVGLVRRSHPQGLATPTPETGLTPREEN
ncbi:hypothetical protein ACFC34_38690 [Streptomyces sp. NPDC056053]|uniref:hypothetical protein n=1 Tax=Streptomyces sp. NPDC056053 TaxID=3345696 RepID=UPI0035D9079F